MFVVANGYKSSMFVTANIVNLTCIQPFACANIERMGNALVAAELDAEVARLLSEQQILSGVSLRELSRKSGVKLTRLGDILKRGRAATAGEIERIAEVLGVEGWKILFSAQTGRPYDEADSALAERRLGEEAVGEASPPRLG
nr:MAG TPA: Helix-turn-helix XRE-family like protein [Caudoviricetes sp.]